MHPSEPGNDPGTAPRSAAAPLDGIRVLDFSRVLAGPYATMLLADFGADVVKIEPPGGDETRQWAPPVDRHGVSTYFAGLNRGKRAIVLDLATEDGLAEARRLAGTADVLVENFRPGVLARYGLDAETLRAAHPGLVHCSITGFGSAPAAAGLPGYDLLVQAAGGLMSITGEPEGEPMKAGVALVDVLTGQHALAGILLALRERDRTGVGAHVEVSLLHSLLSGLVNQAASTIATGVPPARHGNAHPSIAPYALFRAADRPLALAVGNDRQFAALAGALGAPSLATDPRFRTNPDRVAHRDELTQAIDGCLAARSAADWSAALTAAGVPAGPVNTIAEGIRFAESLGLEPLGRYVDEPGDEAAPPGEASPGDRFIAPPIRLDGAIRAATRRAPALDEHRGADWLPRPDDHRTPARTEPT
ncbi:CaiB/BaiF CoA transferase family protein [Agromyces seonyuensis]|uniref:CoA transferase n=1 Tax=Agromyces seonyuensis TaxID=2662446 RepID=A0A6I4P4R0_9MICO|nr:CoA transferase [Agromyces seonyuensis]MWB99329.1 CoA transferase [Agromyces seonyuensis]